MFGKSDHLVNMMRPVFRVQCLVPVFLVILSLWSTTVDCSSAIKKFEYKYSFKPPYLAQKDGSVPFWDHFGNAIASEENLRVTPSLRSQKGSIWSKLQTTFDWWEIELVFRITGRGRVGADGLALWYTEEKGQEGPVFGSSDQWKGLGLFFDSFDNDNKHNNPYIMAIPNDGTKVYDHQNDGSTQQIAGCLRDFRNKPFPVRAKITYFKNTLVVMFNNGMSNNDNDYEMCMRAENVFLPPRGYFGLSAATGGLADDHDVHKFMTWSLLSQEGAGDLTQDNIPNADQQKFDQEFQNYQQQLDQKKEAYIKEHPDAKKEKENEEDWFEEEQIRELRQIFQGQSETRLLIQGLSRKLDEIVGRQETTLSLVNNIQLGGAGAAVGGAVPAHPQVGATVGTSTILRNEVESLLAASRELIGSTREIKNYLTAINTKLDNTGVQQPAAVGHGSIDYTSSFNEIREGVNGLKRDVNLVSQRVHSQPVPGAQIQECPTVSCVSSTLFIGIAVFQVVALIGYAVYKNNKETQAKKFY